MSIVVSDTSPIRALSYLNLVALLADLFGEVIVPPAVAEELRDPPRRFSSVAVERLGFITIRQPTRQSRVEELLQSLDAGEAEAIALAEELAADAILIDEAAGRLTAAQTGLSVVGTLGVLLRSK